MLFMLISKTCNLSKAAGKAVAKKEVVITYCFVVKIYHQYSTKKLTFWKVKTNILKINCKSSCVYVNPRLTSVS